MSKLIILSIGLTVFFIVLKRPWYGLIVILTVSALGEAAQDALNLPMDLAEIAGALVCLAFFGQLCLGKAKIKHTPLDIPVLLLLFALTASLFFSEQSTIKSLIKFSLILAMYWVSAQLLDNRNKIRIFILSFFGLLSLVNLVTLSLFLLGIRNIEIGNITLTIYYSFGGLFDRSFRLLGPYGQPNLYGQLLSIVVPIGFSLLFFFQKRLKIIIIGLEVINILALFLSPSRSAILGALAGCVVIVIFSKEFKNWRKNILPIVLFTTLLITIWNFSNLQFSSFSRLSVDQTIIELYSKNVSRLDIWRTALSIFLENPLGIGFGETKYAIGRELCLGSKSPHNVIISLALQAGIIGLVAIIWLIGRQLISLWYFLRVVEDKELMILAVGCLGASIATWIHNMFHSTLHWILVWLFFSVSSAIVMHCNSKPHNIVVLKQKALAK